MNTFNPISIKNEVIIGVPARLRDIAKTQGENVLLVEGDRQFSANEIGLAMDRCAAFLNNIGVKCGDIFVTLGGATVEHTVIMLGAMAAGAVFAPVPLSAHPDAIAKMIENANAKIVFADSSAKGLHEGARDLDSLMTDIARFDPIKPRAVNGDELLDINYSSGTTGMPKGVEHDVRFRERQIARMDAFGYGPEAVHLLSTPLYSNTTISALLPALCFGGKTIIIRKFSEAEYLNLAERHRATHTTLVPIQLKRLLAFPDFDQFDLSSFKYRVITGALMQPALIKEALERWPGKLASFYGMTEGGVSAIIDYRTNPNKYHTVGKPAGGSDIRIIGENSKELPQGEVGEIVGRSASMMCGYRNASEKTQDAIWISPNGDAFMRTGDAGRFDEDGFLLLLDRKKDMIISGGFNIYAVDLEAALANHPDIQDVAVIGIPSERWEETPHAICVAKSNSNSNPEEVRIWANERLGKLQLINSVEFRNELPRNVMGKILKRKLRDEFWKDKAKA